MFESAMVVSAIISTMKHNDEIADRRAFYGPDAPPIIEQPRRKVRAPRFPRRGETVA